MSNTSEYASFITQADKDTMEPDLRKRMYEDGSTKNAQSSAIKNILGHSNLFTMERYIGSFDTSKTDETLQNLFSKPEEKTPISKETQIIEMLKELSPEQIASIMNSINK